MLKFCLTVLIVLSTFIPSLADEAAAPRRTVSVISHGAKCNGHSDDTIGFRAAIRAASPGGTVSVPVGHCVLSDTLVIDATNQVSIVGAGRGSQIFQSANKTLLQLSGDPTRHEPAGTRRQPP